MRSVLLLSALVALASASAAGTWFWVDADGVTHITDDPEAVPPGVDSDAARLSELWGETVVAPETETAPRGSSSRDERTRRLIRGAIADLERGETARASAALESVLRREPANAEAHWYLALLARQRGRYATSEAHLRTFLNAAGDAYEPWRLSAERRLAELADERRLADPSGGQTRADFQKVASPNFRVQLHTALRDASPDYPETVLRYLEEARAQVSTQLGASPSEPMGVVLYGKAAYLRAHRHRFSFQTVGFFDGRIHVVSAAHPAGELRALLFHEYTHAVFRERTGGDRPYWLNEGLAELLERNSRKRSGLARSERAALRRRIDEGRWIPLRRLAPSFSGLNDGDARAAYLESAAAAAWIQMRTTREQRARLLERLGAGRSDDEALLEVLSLNTDEVDAAVRAYVRSEFPTQTAGADHADEAGEAPAPPASVER